MPFDHPHRRHNPLADEWVLVSSGRAQRPWQGSREAPSPEQLPAYDPDCYLCPGNARAGGHRNPNYIGPYIFDNDYPALQPEAPSDHWTDGLLRAEQHPGRCRVICFSPRHDLTLAGMEPAAVRAVIEAWTDETQRLGATHRWVQVFENRGAAMGASNPHPHGQIWATGFLPQVGEREDRTQRRHHEVHASRLLLDYLAQESPTDGTGSRIVAAGPDWVLLVPFWAGWPFETLLLPRRPVAGLAGLDDGQRESLVHAIRGALDRYDRLFNAPMPYSMGWHQAPFGADDRHWQLHAHVLPPLIAPEQRKFIVGFELLSEMQRDLTPEEAADRLRAVSGQR